jgi:hypothetical protein
MVGAGSSFSSELRFRRKSNSVGQLYIVGAKIGGSDGNQPAASCVRVSGFSRSGPGEAICRAELKKFTLYMIRRAR